MKTINNEQIINRIIDDANVLIAYSTPDGNVAFCNKILEAFIGRHRDEIIGRSIFDLLYPNNDNTLKRQMFISVTHDSLNFKRKNSFESQLSDSSKRQKFILWDIAPFLTDNHGLTGVLFLGHDITELKNNDTCYVNIDNAIKNVVSNIKEYALYAINLDRKLTYYGMGSELLFGWKKEEAIFKDIGLLHLEEDLSEKLPAMLEEAKNFGLHEELEISLVKKNKEVFPVMLTVLRFLDNEKNLSGYIFIARDITERKKLEFQMLQSEKLAALGQLVAGIAHEINNPLFVISGRSEMLLKKRRFFFGDHHREIKIIAEQADRIRTLVGRLLKFSRYSPTQYEKIDLKKAIDGVLPLLSYQKSTLPGIEIKTDIADDLRPIEGDLNQLQEVFLNLLINACQAMPQGGKIVISAYNWQNRFVEIRINDTGVGIPEHNMKNMFMPFFTTKKDGTGLGLSICYNIIKNHNGAISVESNVNKGTTFIIRLPVFK